MTDLSKLGEQLRRELGQPPPGWTERQRMRLRGVDLTENPRRPLVPILTATAIFSLMVAGGTYFWNTSKTRLLAQDQSSTPAKTSGDTESSQSAEQFAANDKSKPPHDSWLGAKGQTKTYPIEGGGTIRLESDARGRLDESTTEGTRFDLHEGTAHFDVEKRENQPFSVVAGAYRILVVGTRFSVAYRPPDALDVSVIEGTIEVRLPERADSLPIHAGEVLEASSEGFSLRKDGKTRPAPSADSSAASPSAPAEVLDWRKLYQEGTYQKACHAARSEGHTKLRSRLRVDELIDLAGALTLCGETDAAMTALQAVHSRFPTTREAHDALFLIGRIHAARGSSSLAISHFERYLNQQSGGRFTAEALGRLIELHVSQGQTAEAKRFATQYLKLTPHGAYHRLADSLVNSQ